MTSTLHSPKEKHHVENRCYHQRISQPATRAVAGVTHQSTPPLRRTQPERVAASFTAQGVLQPLLVRTVEEGKYEVVAGARRLRAAKLAALKDVPVRVISLSDSDCVVAQLVENIQREGVQNILIAGGTGSGKTTLLNVLADAIPESDRILIIEDTAELHIRKPHIVSAESQTDTHRSQITFDDLLKAVLRHRPDRIIVGEVRGPEARTLLDAMNTGHRGTLATIHASSAEEALHRLAALAIRGNSGLTLPIAENEVAKCIDIVIYVQRTNGIRSVSEIRSLHQS